MTTGRVWMELTARLVRTARQAMHRASTTAATTALVIGMTAGVTLTTTAAAPTPEA